jgi:hypothetical protein
MIHGAQSWSPPRSPRPRGGYAVPMSMIRLASLAVCLLAGLPLCAGADPQGRQLDADGSPLATLVDALPEMSEVARLELAGLIVEGVLAAYEQELEAVRAELEREGSDPARLSRWSRATAPIIAGLRSAQAEIPVAELWMCVPTGRARCCC